MSLAGAVLSIFQGVSTSLAIRGKNQQLTDQAVAEANYAVKDAEYKNQRLNVRQSQEQEGISLEQVRRARQGRRERSALGVRLSEAGVYGGSSAREEIASMIQEHEDIQILDRNKDLIAENTAASKLSVKAEGQTRLNQANATLKSRTPAGLTALSIFSSAASGYLQGQSLEIRGTGRTSNKSKESLDDA